MKKYALFALILLALIGCQTTDKDANQVVVYEYGIPVDSFNIVKGRIKKGQTLSTLFAELGCKPTHTNQLCLVPDSILNIKNVRAGDEYSAFYTQTKKPKLMYVVYHSSLVEHYVFHLEDSLHIHTFTKPVRTETKVAKANIESSLWNAIADNDLNLQLALDLSEIYAWSVDFFGLQKNDGFIVYYDELYVDSTSVGIGKIHGAKFIHNGKTFYAFNYENDDIKGFWDEDGKSVRKAFLKAPLKFSRVSSGFTYRRKHPVYKTVRPHTGVDYAAPLGTPVMSIGNGVVIQKGYKGGGGNTVKIKHNSNYSTAYLHLSKYGKGIKVGSRVEQGQVIGYVGSTGASTGAHLDFRVWKNNKPINPLTMESPSAEPIPEKYLPEFHTLRDSLRTKIDLKL